MARIASWLRLNVHISWHIVALSLGVICGAASSPFLDHAFSGVYWLLIALSLLIIVNTKRQRYFLVFMVLAGLLVGLQRGSDVGIEITHYKPYYGKQVSLSGRVNEDSSYGTSGDQRIRLDKVTINGQPMTATVWVSSSEKVDIKRGDFVSVAGVLSEGFGNIPASMFRANIVMVERPSLGDVGRRSRDWFGRGVYNAMPEQDANFALAFLLGQKLELPNELGDKLRTIGLIHAIVASGYHLTVLVGVVRRLLTNISKYLTALCSLGMIAGFILITGFSPSMTRAGIVAGLSLAAWYYGRRLHPVVLLSFAAALTVLYNPQYVWGDIGWYLSFTSFAGVILLAPLLQQYFWGDRKPGLLREILVVTFAAQVATLPITISVFGYYSVYALLANLLVVPIIPLIMLATFVSGIVGLLCVPLAHIFGFSVSIMLRYVTSVVDFIVGLPASRSDVMVGSVFVVIAYLIITALSIGIWRITRYNFRSADLDKRLF